MDEFIAAMEALAREARNTAKSMHKFNKQLQRMDKAAKESAQAQPWPTAGMPIQLQFGAKWFLFTSKGDGNAFRHIHTNMDEEISLTKIDWRYLPAPPEWPEWANSYLALDTGEYHFARSRGYKTGEVFKPGGGVNTPTRTILHVEHRPEKA